MTDVQRKKIKLLRYQGFGYDKIASSVGLSRDSVRGYCVRNGLNGYAAELVTEYNKIIEEGFIFVFCLNCGSKIERNNMGRKKKYCSLNCKRVWEKLTENRIFLIVSIAGKSLNLLELLEENITIKIAILGIDSGERRMRQKS